MKNPTSKDKWLMGLNVAGAFHRVLFDGEKVYDYNFPAEEIVSIPTFCGIKVNQETLSQACKKKMESMKVVSSAFDGTWMAEDKSTPFTSSVASETYWCS
jgi:hypothetical protein